MRAPAGSLRLRSSEGQAMVEFLIIAGVVIAILAGMRGTITDAITSLMEDGVKPSLDGSIAPGQTADRYFVDAP